MHVALPVTAGLHDDKPRTQADKIWAGGLGTRLRNDVARWRNGLPG